MAVIKTLYVTLSLDEDHQEVTDALETLSQWVLEDGTQIVSQYASFGEDDEDEEYDGVDINKDCGHCITPNDRCSDQSDRNCMDR